MSKIFIQIASYRDPQLIPTLKDMIANAKKPKNLVFAIARQFSETDGFDNLDEFRTDKRFKILDIPYQDAKGVCWARNLTQQLYDGNSVVWNSLQTLQYPSGSLMKPAISFLSASFLNKVSSFALWNATTQKS